MDSEVAESRSASHKRALDLTLEIASVLFVCSSVLCSVVLWSQGARLIMHFTVAASVPAAASIGLSLLAWAFPSLVAVNRLAFPLYLTAPLIHCLLMVMVATLTHATFGVRVPPPQLLPTLLWKEPPFLALAFAAQLVLLAALSAMKSPDREKVQR